MWRAWSVRRIVWYPGVCDGMCTKYAIIRESTRLSIQARCHDINSKISCVCPFLLILYENINIVEYFHVCLKRTFIRFVIWGTIYCKKKELRESVFSYINFNFIFGAINILPFFQYVLTKPICYISITRNCLNFQMFLCCWINCFKNVNFIHL